MLKPSLGSAALSGVLLLSGAAEAETVKWGIIGPMTGANAVMGEQWRQGIDTYLAQHGNEAGGRQIEVIYRDTGGDPAKAKQLVQELIVRDKVSFVGGFGLSPEAAASAPIINQAKIPAFLFHTASPALVGLSPYFLRMGQNIATCAEVASAWTLKENKKTAYIAVADYAPGIDVLNAFKKHFTAHGGVVVGEERIPLNTVDFSAYAERIAAAKPDIVEIFIPPGSPAVGFVKALAARDVLSASVVIGQGEAEDPDLHLFDNAVKGFHSSIYYSSTINTPENRTFLDTLKQKFGSGTLPSTFTLGAYDATGLVFKILEAEAGKPLDGVEEMATIKGYSWASPRGKITLNAETREPIEDYVIREVEETPDGLRNVVIDTFKQVDPATFGSGG